MCDVLVVDDSPFDRELVGKMLKEQSGYRVDYAADGREALDRIASQRPLVVVTDLQMPEMDGMELVRKVSEKYAGVPVILITAHGSEEIARQALTLGAADYVPKSRLTSRLLDAIEGVLTMAVSDRAEDLLADSVCFSETRYELQNDPRLILPLANRVRRKAVAVGVVQETDGLQLAKAIAEALRNAMFHGNLELPLGSLNDSDPLSPADADVLALVRDEPPYCNRRVFVTTTVNADAVRIVVRDEGSGFDVGEVPDLDADSSSLSSGASHGFVLIRSFVDEVSFNSIGNEVTLVKRRSEGR